ncbi:hypothetical protein NE865_13752 [Phthorimaea operculella]|nr:hypothetical protein NE865_13752 [Phthorimaea operculella]
MYSQKSSSQQSFTVVGVKTSITEMNRGYLNIIRSNSQSTISEDDLVLPYFTAAKFATCLEDAILRLNILGQCNNELRAMRATQHMESLLAKKYSVMPPAEPEDDIMNIKYPLDCDENKVDKMFDDRKFCLVFLKDMYKELALKKSFTHLKQYVEEKDLRLEELFTKEVDERKLSRRQYKQKLRLQRNAQKSALYAAEATISDLIDVIGDSAHISAIDARYMENWKAALTEQHALIIQETEDQCINKIRQYKEEHDKEIRAHEEVERFNMIVIEETRQKVEDIMEKYADDIEAIDLRIQIAMSRLGAIVNQRRDLEHKLASRQRDIDEWRKFTKARAEKQALTNKKTNAAVTVQAWWRGLLVRKQLGPFRKQRAKSGGKKKGAKENVED